MTPNGNAAGKLVASFFMLAAGLGATGCQAPAPAGAASAGREPMCQAHAVFTVAEGKRLIARAVARMPIVQNALRDGMVIVCRGTTNTYVAEELLGRPVPHGAFVVGHVLPEKGGKKLPQADRMGEVVLVRGRHRPDLTMDEALKQLKPGDVIIKGGNALDSTRQAVGVWTGSPTGGTVGKIQPLLADGRVHLVIPIGLEKQVAGSVTDIAVRVNEPADNLLPLPRMRILKGHVITEIEALGILADVTAWQASAGGIGGAEGAVWLVWRGPRANVEKARQVAADVQGEAPFIP